MSNEQGNPITAAMDELKSMAAKLKLSDDEAERFIDSGMERMGFRRLSTWAAPEDEENDKGGDFFSRRKASGDGGKRAVNDRPYGYG